MSGVEQRGALRLLSLRIIAPLIVVALVGAYLFVSADDDSGERTVVAHFSRAVSIYKGTDVRILGVTVGKVTSVTPEGDSVRVAMSYDAQYKVPANAKAVIVTPTLVADRFVQLTPVYTSGPVMADQADIPEPKTLVPVELDRIYQSLSDLTQTLGPNGVNADGTLNHLLSAGAKALQGEGKRGNQMIRDLAAAAKTFGDNSGELFDTVSQLADFTTTLGANDRLVRGFIQDLAGVSEQLAGERTYLRRLVSSLADTVGTVEGFVKNNRKGLVTGVEQLTSVMRTIASERKSLDTALAVAPVAMGNLVLAFNVASGSVGSRMGIGGNIWGAPQLLCSIVMQQGNLPKSIRNLSCQLITALLRPVIDNVPYLPPAYGKKATNAGDGEGDKGDRRRSRSRRQQTDPDRSTGTPAAPSSRSQAQQLQVDRFNSSRSSFGDLVGGGR